MNQSDGRNSSIHNHPIMHESLFWLQLLIGLAILIANALILVSLTKVRQLQISLRVLLGNMAITDSLVGIFFLFNCIVFNQPQILDKLGCFMRFGTLLISLFVSMVNVVLLALDRCLTIQYPYKYPVWATFNKIVAVVGCSWLASMIQVGIGYVNMFANYHICIFQKLAKAPMYIIPATEFFSLFLIIIICYFFIIKQVVRHVNKIADGMYRPSNFIELTPGPATKERRKAISTISTIITDKSQKATEFVEDEEPRQTTSKHTIQNTTNDPRSELPTFNKKKPCMYIKKYFAVTKTVTLILVVFLGCYAPIAIVLLNLAINPQLINSSRALVNSCLFITVLNSLANPIIYAWKMKQLRAGFLLFFCKKCCLRRIRAMNE